MVSFGHYAVCPSSIYGFWLPFWYLLVIMLHNGQHIPSGKSESVYHRRTDNTMAKRYQGGNQNLYIIEEQTIQLPFGHCVVCSSMIYRFWLSPWYLLAIVLSFLLWYTDSDFPLGICWPLCCLFFYGIQILITPLVSFGHCDGQKIPRV
jgi:hypothetical protein